jgi:hypothetical protein
MIFIALLWNFLLCLSITAAAVAAFFGVRFGARILARLYRRVRGAGK